MGILRDDLRKEDISGVTPEFIKQLANATGNSWPTKRDCEMNNPIAFSDINEKSFDGIEISKGRSYYFYIDEVGVVEQLNRGESVTVKLRKGVNY